MFNNVFSLVKNFKRIINKNTLIQLFVLVIFSVLICTELLHIIETPVNPAFPGYFECFWAAVIGVTAGYSDGFPPTTSFGMSIMIYLTLLGMGAVGTFIAWIASIFVEYKLKEGMGLGNTELKNHIIICNWSFKAEEMVKQLMSDDLTTKKQVVILAERERSPVEEIEGITFISGDPSKETDLKRAGIMDCSVAIILADITESNKSSNIPDSKSILTVLAIESIREEVYTIAEVLDPHNINHFKRANVDEIVASSEFTGKLLVQATLNHGITNLFEKMLTFEEGSEIYKFSVPKSLVGKTFKSLHLSMFEKKFNIIGIEKNGVTILNPEASTTILDDDKLFGICEDEPCEDELNKMFS